MDKKKGDLYWVSCERNIIGTTRVSGQYSRQLHSTKKEVRDLCLDWLRGTLMWLEDNRLVVMSMVGGQAKELQQLAGGVVGHMAFDLRANSLLWNSKIAGWLTLLIGTCRSNVPNYLWIFCRFDNFEFAEGEKPPRW